MMDNEYQDLLDSLYAAVTDLEGWYRFAQRLDEFFQADATHLVLYDLAMQGLSFSVWTQKHIEELYLRLSLLPLEADPRHNAALDLPGKPLTFSTGKDLVASPEYFDGFREVGIEYHLGALVPVASSDMYLVVAVFRAASGLPFTTVDCDRLGELIPHFKRALLLRRDFASLGEGRSAVMNALDQMPMGVVIVGVDASILFVNETARTMANSCDGFAFRNNKIWGARREDTKRLHSEIEQTFKSLYDDDNTGSPTGVVQLTRTRGSPLYVRIQAVTEGEDTFRQINLTRPVGILFISDPDVPDETVPELLQRMFGLTPAESKLTESLVRGCDLKQTQADLRISENTARTHLKSVFRKTDTSNQAELVKLVVTSPAWRKYPASERPTVDH